MQLLDDFWREVKRVMNEKAYQMTYKTGSIGEFMRWTKRVIAEPAAGSKVPKRWFDSQATAQRALGTKTRRRRW